MSRLMRDDDLVGDVAMSGLPWMCGAGDRFQGGAAVVSLGWLCLCWKISQFDPMAAVQLVVMILGSWAILGEAVSHATQAKASPSSGPGPVAVRTPGSKFVDVAISFATEGIAADEAEDYDRAVALYGRAADALTSGTPYVERDDSRQFVAESASTYQERANDLNSLLEYLL